MLIHPALVGVQPSRAMQFFTQFLGIPRPSKGEIQAVRLIQGWAMCHGWRSHIDKAGNISVHVPASAGYENAPALCLQAHLDMVYVPNEPELIQQPIDIEVAGRMLRTKGQTRTLGMDNIAGVVAIMYLAENSTHGPLELLFTTDEEEDFSGVEGWNPEEHGMVSRLLMNFDTPLFRRVAVRSGGVQYVLAMLSPEREIGEAGMCETLVLTGYQGGHNADHVHLGRGNAIKDMALLLQLLPEGSQLVSFAGGDAGNSLPSVATATVRLPARPVQEGWDQPMHEQVRRISAELGREIVLELKPGIEGLPAMSVAATREVIDLIQAIPSGVECMSEFSPKDAAALSTTFSVVATTMDGVLKFKSIARGSNEEALMALAASVQDVYAAHGCDAEFGHFMPAWVQEPGSPLVQSALAAYERHGIPAELREFHCALELRCLIEAGGVTRFDSAVSIGAQVNNEHAVTEEMDLDSFNQTLRVAQEILFDVVLFDVASGKVA